MDEDEIYPDPFNDRDDFEELNANEANDYLHEDTDYDEEISEADYL